MRRKLLFLILFLPLVASACKSAAVTTSRATQPPIVSPAPMETQTSASLVTVNVCYSGTSGAHLPTWYAYEKGLFKKYGLNVKLTSIDSGTSAMTAMLAGDMDLCQIGASSVVNAVVAKQDAVWIAGFYDTYPAFLMVKPEIKSIYDLKGKAVAISSPGSATDAGTRLMLQKFGLLPDKDVALLAIGDEGARIAAMDAGQVSGTLVVAPFNLVASQKGYVELLDMAKLDIPYQYIGIATSHKFLQADRPIVEEFMKAILEAIQSSKKDPEGAKAVLAKYLALDPTKDAAVLDDTYQTMVVENLKSVPDPSLAGIQSLIDNLKNNNPDATQFTPGQVVDTSVLQDMKTSGFLTNLGK